MTALERCQVWVTEVVVGLALCPWAVQPLADETVRWRSTDAMELAELVAEVVFEAQLLVDDSETRTSLLVLEQSGAMPDFPSMLELVAISEAVLEEMDLLDTVQLVGFHPEFQYAGAEVNDPANGTNRSPAPMVHLLRRAELAALAVDGVRVAERNARLLRDRAREE
jgi:hypothetical protein